MRKTILAVILAASSHGFALAQAQQPLAEAGRSAIGYPSVEAALAGLKARSNVVFATEGAWTIVTDSTAPILWSFPGNAHPAYPSAVRREVKPGPDGVHIEMNVHCEASKTACDDLVRSFQQLNQKIAASMRGR